LHHGVHWDDQRLQSVGPLAEQYTLCGHRKSSQPSAVADYTCGIPCLHAAWQGVPQHSNAYVVESQILEKNVSRTRVVSHTACIGHCLRRDAKSCRQGFIGSVGRKA
jgi:hypothetical protein